MDMKRYGGNVRIASADADTSGYLPSPIGVIIGVIVHSVLVQKEFVSVVV
jgi:hypothetical protein